MWLIHEHCTSTSAIDKYWIYETKEQAIKEFREMIEKWKFDIDMNSYKELYEDYYYDEIILDKEIPETLEEFFDRTLENITDSTYIELSGQDYLVLSELDGDNFGRRP